MDIFSLLDRLEDVIQNATRVPLTGKVMVDPEEVLGILERLRDALPEEIRAASRIADERERILATARAEAEAIVQEAKGYVAHLTDETAVAREARVRAEETIEQAKRVAREIRAGALEYAREVLARVEQNLEKACDTVRQGREALDKE